MKNALTRLIIGLATAPLLCYSLQASPPITLDLAKKADNSDWIVLADPAGKLNKERGITDAEAAVFDLYGKLLVTCSKADGRHWSNNHGKTAHVSLWNVETGEQIWDKKRSRGPDNDNDGYPDDQPSNGEDEVEIAIFNPDGRFVAAAGEDDKIEVWRVREDTHGADEWLSDPILVKTFLTGDGDPETDDAAIDSMSWSHDGRLLLAGTEGGGIVEVYRTQGDPSTWTHMHTAVHGGNPGWAVNSLDLTEDDQYVGTVGTDTNAVFWRLDVTEDGGGLITDVDMVRLATLYSPNGKSIDGSGREARFEKNGDRHFIFTLERKGLVMVYKTSDLIAWNGLNTEGPDPIQSITNGDDIKDGNEIEPADYAESGRFLAHDGDTRVNGNSDGIFPGYLRILETKEIQENAPMPDPVFVQRALATEFISFSPDDSLLASGHGDGTARLWDVTISGSETLFSEAFNESTEDAGRWTLFGSQSTGTDTVLVSQSFDSDPGWTGNNNATGGNSFGFSNSDELDLGAGVAGGTVDRSPASPAYYADTANFSVSLDENGVITGSGKLLFGEQDTGGGVFEEDGNQDVVIGHFKEVTNGSADPRTHAVGIYVQEPSGDFDGQNDADESFRVSGWFDVPGFTGSRQFHTQNLLEGVVYDFEYTYDPAGDSGNGTFSVTINGSTQTIDADGTQDIDVDAFGMALRNRNQSETPGEHDYNVFIDDVVYTAFPSGNQWGSSGDVAHTTAFRGHRGLYYLAANNLGGETHALEIDAAWDISGFTERGLQFAAVAAPGAFETGDFLRLLADTDGDETFDLLIAEFLPDADGDLALDGPGGVKLNSVFLDDDGTTEFYTFEDFFVDLESALPANFGGTIRFRVEANTDADDEEICFDSLRVTGKAPGSGGPTPLVHYEFDENGGSTAGDATGNSRDGAITGATWSTETPDGSTSSLSFDGSGDYVEDDDAENYLDGLDAYTFTVWIKAATTGDGDPGIFLTNMPGSDNYTQLRYDTAGWGGGGDDLIKMGTTTSTGNTQGESVSLVQSADWQHLALTWSSGNEPKLYIDGVLTGWDTDANPANPGSLSGTLSSITTLLIGKGGKDNNLTGASWDGLIDDFRVYDQELTQSQINDIYNGN